MEPLSAEDTADLSELTNDSHDIRCLKATIHTSPSGKRIAVGSRAKIVKINRPRLTPRNSSERKSSDECGNTALKKGNIESDEQNEGQSENTSERKRSNECGSIALKKGNIESNEENEGQSGDKI